MIFLFAIIGLAIGSFLNVLIVRLPKNKNILTSSVCLHCNVKIEKKYNIPIFGYLFLRGISSCCQRALPKRYLVVELLGLITFILLYLFSINYFEIIAGVILLSSLIIIFYIDFEHELILHVITFPNIIIGILYNFFKNNEFINFLIAALLGYIIIWLLNKIYLLLRKKNGMGMGDAFMMSMIGAYFGIVDMIIIFYLSVIVALFFVLIYFVIFRKVLLKIPFGCFLSICTYFFWFIDLESINIWLKF